tara:strand:- start:3379 stop:3528 length:150 start_codon:yes stop_codon:yes gene_type:complete
MLKHVPKRFGRFGEPGIVFSFQSIITNKKSLPIGKLFLFGGLAGFELFL